MGIPHRIFQWLGHAHLCVTIDTPVAAFFRYVVSSWGKCNIVGGVCVGQSMKLRECMSLSDRKFHIWKAAKESHVLSGSIRRRVT